MELSPSPPLQIKLEPEDYSIKYASQHETEGGSNSAANPQQSSHTGSSGKGMKHVMGNQGKGSSAKGAERDSKHGGGSAEGSAESIPITPCAVCDAKAAGHFFGAYVCMPCKAFFIRATTESAPAFQCAANQNCNITLLTRSSCKYCRLQKCLNVGMCRKERPTSVELAEGQEKCVVCNDLANGLHFGAITCEGCKKFFRRGLSEYQRYECHQNKTCEINPKTRNACRYCRYQRCISRGMSREAIKMGRPSKVKTRIHTDFGVLTPEKLEPMESQKRGSSSSVEDLSPGKRPSLTGYDPSDRLTNAYDTPHAYDPRHVYHSAEASAVGEIQYEDSDSHSMDRCQEGISVEEGQSSHHISPLKSELVDPRDELETSSLPYEINPTKGWPPRVLHPPLEAMKSPQMLMTQFASDEKMDEGEHHSALKEMLMSVPSGPAHRMSEAGSKFRPYDHAQRRAPDRSTVIGEVRSAGNIRFSASGSPPESPLSQHQPDVSLSDGEGRVANLVQIINRKSKIAQDVLSSDAEVHCGSRSVTVIAPQPFRTFTKQRETSNDSGYLNSLYESQSSGESYNKEMEDPSLCIVPVPEHLSGDKKRLQSCNTFQRLVKFINQSSDSNEENIVKVFLPFGTQVQLPTNPGPGPFPINGMLPSADELMKEVNVMYWLNPTLPNTDECFTEKHQNVIDYINEHYIKLYEEVLRVSVTASQSFKNMAPQSSQQPFPETLLLSKAITEMVTASVCFCMSLTVAFELELNECVNLIRANHIAARLLMSCLKFYNEEENVFSCGYYPLVPQKGRIDYQHYVDHLELAAQLHKLDIDDIEGALLCAQLVLATDGPSPSQSSCLSQKRLKILRTFQAYAIAKYGSRNQRIKTLFKYIPRVRTISLQNNLLDQGIFLMKSGSPPDSLAPGMPGPPTSIKNAASTSQQAFVTTPNVLQSPTSIVPGGWSSGASSMSPGLTAEAVSSSNIHTADHTEQHMTSTAILNNSQAHLAPGCFAEAEHVRGTSPEPHVKVEQTSVISSTTPTTNDVTPIIRLSQPKFNSLHKSLHLRPKSCSSPQSLASVDTKHNSSLLPKVSSSPHTVPGQTAAVMAGMPQLLLEEGWDTCK